LPEALHAAAQPSVDRFNAVSLARSTDDGLHQLVGSLTGQATGWTRLAMLQIDLCRQGVSDARQMAQAMLARLTAEGRPVMASGRALSGDEECLAHLRDAAQVFLTKEAPLLRRMGVL